MTHLHRLLQIQLPSPEQALPSAWHDNTNIAVTIKRDDLIHPVIAGNKWRKLSQHLIEITSKTQQATSIISFGGGYSNHLHALGYCCQQLGYPLTAIVRGDYSNNMTPMLQDLVNWGTQINFVTRSEYARRHEQSYLNEIAERNATTNPIIIPEGGSDSSCLSGAAQIISELVNDYDYIIAPVASGGTLAGLCEGVKKYEKKTKILGIAVLKGEGYLESLVAELLNKNAPRATTLTAPNNFTIIHDYHCGGYAKAPEYLRTACSEFTKATHIPVEPIYSGKLIYAVQQLISKGYFEDGSRVLLLHTGGLQGAR